MFQTQQRGGQFVVSYYFDSLIGFGLLAFLRTLTDQAELLCSSLLVPTGIMSLYIVLRRHVALYN